MPEKTEKEYGTSYNLAEAKMVLDMFGDEFSQYERKLFAWLIVEVETLTAANADWEKRDAERDKGLSVADVHRSSEPLLRPQSIEDRLPQGDGTVFGKPIMGRSSLDDPELMAAVDEENAKDAAKQATRDAEEVAGE